MELHSFPNCCTARVLAGMGQSNTAGYGGGLYTEHTFQENVRRCIRQAARENVALIFAITNNDQKVAEKCLPLLGFVATHKDVGKMQHQDKTLTSWVYQVTGADKRALPIPVNPFAQPAAPVIEPVVAPPVAVAPGVVTRNILGKPHEVMNGEDLRKVEEWLRTRVRINARIRVQHRRDNNGRFQALPIAGKFYNYEQLRNIFVPDDMRYRRIRMAREDGGLSHSASSKDGSGMGVAPHAFNHNAIGFVFA